MPGSLEVYFWKIRHGCGNESEESTHFAGQGQELFLKCVRDSMDDTAYSKGEKL